MKATAIDHTINKPKTSFIYKIPLIFVALGLLTLITAWGSMGKLNHPVMLALGIVGLSIGAIWHYKQQYLTKL